MHLLFLGTGAGCGVPSFFCDCIACREAKSEQRYRRSRCALLIQGDKNTLIDAPPDLRHQLIREKIERIDHLILTHSHYDHIGGLGELEFYVRLKRQESIPAYMAPSTYNWLANSYGFMQDCLSIQQLDFGWNFNLDGTTFTGLEVTHSQGTLGFLIKRGTKRFAYIPDTGPLPSSTQEKLKEVDTLVIGASFWGKNWMPKDHLSIDEAIQIGLKLNAREIYLTHLSMHHDTPITNQTLEAHLRNFGTHIHLAYDGLVITL